MHSTLQTLLIHQFEAALATLRQCIERCPDEHWTAPVGNLPVWRVISHALFFADYYLSSSEAEHQPPAFHRNDELLWEYLPGDPYTKEQLNDYVEHCLVKARGVVSGEIEDVLSGPSGFERRTYTRAELHVCNIRHIQHHAAQVSLALRRDAGVSIDWFGSGTEGPPA